ncbi:MAG: hypothetical protein HFG20_03945 [Anaerotruncus sp.]|nr:hypothetical protein [Anaerotruncus sp.]
MKKNKSLFQPILYIPAGCCTAMTISALFFDLRLFYICMAVSIACVVMVAWQMYEIRQHTSSFLVEMGQTLTTLQQDALTSFPLSVFVCSGEGEILWCNVLAEKHVMDGENIYARSIYSIIGSGDITSRCPESGYDVGYKDKNYAVYISRAAGTERDLYIVYFFDNTELKHYTQEYFETRPSVILISLDNYEELQQGMKDNERTRIMGQIEYEISKYISEHGGLMLKTERDRFMAVVEERNLRGMISARFPLLEQIRAIETENKLVATLSIGVGRDASTLGESEQFARQALDMALGRGGDQAAVRGSAGYEFFGGVSSGMEKRTKVKTRIVASALAELINSSDNVIVMGHRLADLDCFGSSVGMMRAARLMGKEAFVAIRREKCLVGQLYDRMVESGYGEWLIEPEEALQRVTRRTLLIICDTHTSAILESKELYNACKNVVVIDHHRKMVGHIDDTVIFYHEPFSSSASEMVTELVQYFGDKIRLSRLEAEALLAGIMLDTKNFVLKTGVRTFEAAAYLRRMGADTVEVKKLFASSMESYQRKIHLVADAQVYKGCAIAVCEDHNVPDLQVTAAQAADELLTISGVQASFLIYELNDGVSFSARSMGQLNVQLIMEKLGGGGHHTMAGAQIAQLSLEQARERLIEAIDAFYEENYRAPK